MTREALVVGINTYQHLNTLNAPAQDAEAIANRLETDGDFRVRRLPEVIEQSEGVNKPIVGKTTGVSKAQLENALKELFTPNSDQLPEIALFYFSGHGIPGDGFYKGYLATSEADPKTPNLALSLRWLQWLLGESPVRQQIVWLDCCHSGGLLVNVQDADPGDRGRGKHRCFIASSRDYQSSWQDLNSPYSVLTKALLEGLDPNRQPDRWVTNISLTDFINQQLRGEIQTPVCNNSGEPILLTRSWRVAEPASPKPVAVDSGICPYKGLEFFSDRGDDPQYFFGRESLTDQLLDKVRQSNFVAIVGASGSGKSSVLRAGLLHQLRLGRRVSGSDRWHIKVMRPDDRPLQNLALAFVDPEAPPLDRAAALGQAEGLLKEGSPGLRCLVQTDGAERLVLVVDQFEEVFTLCKNSAAREQFLECLLGALEDLNRQLCVIVAMRSDFVGKCLEKDYSGLAQQVEQNLIAVRPLNPDELHTAICKPAELVGLTIEPALVQQILDDLGNAPGSLPLLQDCLTELWRQRQGNQLQFTTYQTLGGVKGNLAKRATALYTENFTAPEQDTIRHIFLALTQLGEGTEDTRRRVLQQDLITAKHPEDRISKVVQELATAKLVVTSEVVQKGSNTRAAVIDVAHEALIRHWPLLRGWIETSRDTLRQQRRIETSAETWRDRQYNPGYFLQGLQLEEAKQFQKHQADQFPLSEFAQTFIRKSQRHRLINRLKIASWLLIPATLLLFISESYFREAQVRKDYASLESASKLEQKQAVQDLVRGCSQQKDWLPVYFRERVFGNCRSLEHTELSKADLRGADLRGADLNLATLSSANLSNTNLSNADLSSATLSSANLSNANLSNANLSISHLLSNANIRGFNLTIFHSLRGARRAGLSLVYLSGADLSNADLSSADLIGTDLSSADLSSANLSNANLSDADLSNANLSNANLSDANLFNGGLGGAYLSGAILLAVDFSQVKAGTLTAQQLEDITPLPLLCGTRLPASIPIDGNRDCEQLPKVLHDRYPGLYPTLEEAEKEVEDAKAALQKK